ncbi:DUF1292 domain-containing protein [Clostridium sp. cel8]|jgi:hypothetical protein|uniref:DUF1292 domain-containing protein n=1 Tax=Clostridium sp. cel8 TaxID=2663123 RepID=UPI0015F4925D|nr:DUF1292 domain-containing protein [Clostridium sp. cel8]MBA5851411.1 DUF1292 domain-containing protein [Clostridium sp. cel8]
MNKIDKFIDSEKNYYGKIFVDISYAIENVSPFLDKQLLNRRKYIVKIGTLKRYIDLLESCKSETQKSKFLNIFKSDKYISLLKDYKNDNLESLNQLDKCSKCKCLNCIVNCKFDGCLACKNDSNIAYCDKKKINVSLHDNFVLYLRNNKTGKDGTYNVIATLQDIELDRKYIIIQDLESSEKFILYYYPGISEDSYGEITDPNEFDFIVSIFQIVDK